MAKRNRTEDHMKLHDMKLIQKDKTKLHEVKSYMENLIKKYQELRDGRAGGVGDS